MNTIMCFVGGCTVGCMCLSSDIDDMSSHVNNQELRWSQQYELRWTACVLCIVQVWCPPLNVCWYSQFKLLKRNWIKTATSMSLLSTEGELMGLLLDHVHVYVLHCHNEQTTCNTFSVLITCAQIDTGNQQNLIRSIWEHKNLMAVSAINPAFRIAVLINTV